MDTALKNFAAMMQTALVTLGKELEAAHAVQTAATENVLAKLDKKIDKQNQKIAELSSEMSKIRIRDVLNHFKYVVVRKYSISNRCDTPSYENFGALLDVNDQSIEKLLREYPELTRDMLEVAFTWRYDTLAHLDFFEKTSPEVSDKKTIKKMIQHLTPPKQAALNRIADFMFTEENWMMSPRTSPSKRTAAGSSVGSAIEKN